jgi:hypothetical protein
MTCLRMAVLATSALVLANGIPAFGQSVVSAHSGVVYFFEGSVFVDGQRLEQKFGKFPDIGEGRELRTEQGRAEVLLTPGVVLRIDRNSAVRMIADQLTDTRVALLSGAAILESNGDGSGNNSRLIYQNWQVRVPHKGVYRIDAQTPQVRVYQGDVEVSAEGSSDVSMVRAGEVLPLAGVLMAERSATPASDDFKSWAMSRSDAISADNAIAAGITDAPDAAGDLNLALGGGNGLGGLSYFPLTGIPSLGITNPYGLSFWSPYQSTLSSQYYPAYLYGSLYPGWPTRVRFIGRPTVFPVRTSTGLPRYPSSPSYTPTPLNPVHRAPAPQPGIAHVPARGAAPHMAGHAGGHR